MPETEPNTNIYNYPMARKGINLYSSILELKPDECNESQNVIWRNGIVKRGGQKKLSTNATEVNAGNAIFGLHRFYKKDGTTKQLIAVSNTDVRYNNSGIWTTISTGQTANKQTYLTTWGPLNHVYVANGVDDPFKWDGTTKTQFSTFNAANIPSTSALMFLPYQDRMLVIEGGDLRWSGSFIDGETLGDDWETLARCGVRPDVKLFGMQYHSSTNINAGYSAKILLAGANGMYLFSGSDLRVPSTTGNYTIFPLAIKVGCNAPRTMQWTPAGTIWLGIDRQVYLLPFNGTTPVPIGDKIRSNRTNLEGIESIPAAEIENACAVYHKGFYILSITKKGETLNSTQWWLDVNRLRNDENNLWSPWYGPMTGQNISVFETQGGNGDSGELIGGEANGSTGSFVYELNDIDTESDSGNNILVKYKTYYHNLGNPYFKKDINRGEVELLNTGGTVKVEFHDSTKVFNESLWTCDTTTGKIYNIKTNGTIIFSFKLSDLDATATSPTGVAVADDGTLWISDSVSNKIYNIPTTGDSITSSFATTTVDANANTPTGITVDSNGSLWFSDSNTGKVYNTTTSGVAISNFIASSLWVSNGILISSFATSVFEPNPLIVLQDVSEASDGTLWVCDSGLNNIHNIQTNGTLISSFSTGVYGGTDTTGITEASDGTLWVCDRNKDKIYNIQTNGTLISSFATSVYDASATQPEGISEASNGTLWVSDGLTNKIYNIQTNGTLISSFATSVYDASATSPKGISEASDGTLWVCDQNTDKIYNIQTNGILISSFAIAAFDASATSLTGISEASDGTLWVSNFSTKEIYNIRKNSKIANIQQDGTLISSFITSVFDTKSANLSGITEALDGTLWVCDSSTDKVYNVETNGTLISSFAIAAFDATATNMQAITEASNGTLYISDSNNEKIYNIQKDGTLITSFNLSVFDVGATDTRGISEASDGTLWVCDIASEKIYNIQTNGTLISSFAASVFDASATQPEGISEASNGTLWVSDSNTDKIYNIQTNGTLISSFATSVYDTSATSPIGISATGHQDISDITIAPDRNLWLISSLKITNVKNTGSLLNTFLTSVFDSLAIGATGISIAGNGTLWITDSTTDKLYNVTTTGTLISSFATSQFDASATAPNGIGVTTNIGTNFDLAATSTPTRKFLEISPTIDPRRLALVIRHNNSSDKFELFDLAIEAKEATQIFAKDSA